MHAAGLPRRGTGALRAVAALIVMLTRAVVGVVALGILAVAILISYGIFSRKYFDAPLNWSEEVSRYAIAWVGLTYISVALWRGQHIRANLLSDRLLRRPLNVLQWFAMCAVGVLFVVTGMQMVHLDYTTDALSVGTLQAPYWVVHACIPVAGMAIVIVCALQMVQAGWIYAQPRLAPDRGEKIGPSDVGGLPPHNTG